MQSSELPMVPNPEKNEDKEEALLILRSLIAREIEKNPSGNLGHLDVHHLDDEDVELYQQVQELIKKSPSKKVLKEYEKVIKKLRHRKKAVEDCQEEIREIQAGEAPSRKSSQFVFVKYLINEIYAPYMRMHESIDRGRAGS